MLSGALLTASFPPGRLEWVAWFALVPLLLSIKDEYRSNAFKLSMIAGMTHYLTLIYWIIVVLNTYGGLDYLTSVSALILLSLYLSVYLGLFSLLFIYLRKSRFQILPAACVWVCLEFLRAKFITGFPWCLLGYSQFKHPTLIQITDVVGVYGLSFLIMAINMIIYLLFLKYHVVFQNKIFRLEAVIVLFMVIGTVFYGRFRLQDPYTDGSDNLSIRTAVVQGNIDQSLKWDAAFQEQTLDRYHRLTRLTYGFQPDLVVWPETSVPLFFQNKTELSEKVVEIGKECGASLIFGSPAYEKGPEMVKYYNRSYLLSPDGTVSGYYDKIHLVPFGEYVPLKRFLPFIHRLVQAAGDFTAGQEEMPLNHQAISAGVLICFEGIFPELSRAQTKNGATILVNITNDAWYGMTSAPYQLLMMSAIRAVENKRWLIRSANTGISAFIDPYGRIIKHSSLFTEGILIQKIQPTSERTFYTRYGDIFIYMILIICLMLFLYRLYYAHFLINLDPPSC